MVYQSEHDRAKFLALSNISALNQTEVGGLYEDIVL